MEYRRADYLVESGYARTLGHAYQLIARGQVPGVLRVGRAIRIDTKIFRAELARRALNLGAGGRLTDGERAP